MGEYVVPQNSQVILFKKGKVINEAIPFLNAVSYKSCILYLNVIDNNFNCILYLIYLIYVRLVQY